MDTAESPKFRFFRQSRTRKSEHLGKKAELKIFYENFDETSTWVDYAQPSLPEPKKVKFEGAAIQMYYKMAENSFKYGNVANYTISHIKIQSPFIRKVLEDDFKKYGLVTSAESVEIRAPLKVLFFARDKIAETSKTAEDAETRDHMDLLCRKVVDEGMGQVIEEYEELMQTQEITFDHLWTIFPLGMLVLRRRSSGYEQGFRVSKTAYHKTEDGEMVFVIDNQSADFNGYHFGLSDYEYTLPHFTGKRKISSLNFCPYLYMTKPEELRERFTQRGRRVLDFQGICHSQHAGIALERFQGEGDVETRTVYHEVQLEYHLHHPS